MIHGICQAGMACGEKEWYFLCPRYRKYRNSTRPNRVTGGGFWKATGTDRPIYSSGAAVKCIGLKKSLVFYKGRAATGFKTDWMMHEFRMPSATERASIMPSNKFTDRSIAANEAWAICRIFKRTSAAPQRAMAQNWISSSAFQPGSISFAPSMSEPAAISSINFSPNDSIYTHLDFTSSEPVKTIPQNPPGLPYRSASILIQPHSSDNVQQRNTTGHYSSPSLGFSDCETCFNEHLGIIAPSLQTGLTHDQLQFNLCDAWSSSAWDYTISPSTIAPTCGN